MEILGFSLGFCLLCFIARKMNNIEILTEQCEVLFKGCVQTAIFFSYSETFIESQARFRRHHRCKID